MEITVVSKIDLDELSQKRNYLPKITYKNLLKYVNDVIDWKNSKFPLVNEAIEFDNDGSDAKVKKKYDTSFCGNPPELTSGISFIAGKQYLVFADENTLICLNSETGAYGMSRVINTKVLSAVKLQQKLPYLKIAVQDSYCRPELLDQINKSFEWLNYPFEEGFSVISDEIVTNIPEVYKSYTARYLLSDWLRAITKEEIHKLVLQSDDTLIIPIEFYISDNKIYYLEEDIIDEQQIASILISYLSYNIELISECGEILEKEVEEK